MIFLIPAAGKGTRAGLSYPKCLHKHNGREIIISNLIKINSVALNKGTIFKVVVLIAKGTLNTFTTVIGKYSLNNLDVQFVEQIEAKGTASAVWLSYLPVKHNSTDRYSIIWGDCIGYKEETLKKSFQEDAPDVVIPGLYMRECYTKFEVNAYFSVLSCKETKGLKILPSGFTDIGVFTINKAKSLFDALSKFIKNSEGKKEDSFIEFISDCCDKNVNIKFLNCCSEDEKQGFNSFEDLKNG